MRCYRYILSSFIGVVLLAMAGAMPAAASAATATVNDTAVGTSLNQFEYSGYWLTYAAAGAGMYRSDDHYTDQVDAAYKVRFSGTQVKVYGTVGPNMGKQAISIDGGTETIVDAYASTRTDQKLLYTSPTLISGNHTLRVRITGTKNPSSSGLYGQADRVDITSPAPTSEPVVKATTREVGSPPLSDAEAASHVRPAAEVRDQNYTANHRVPTPEELRAYYDRADAQNPHALKVTGQFTGTTDEIIQWAAWKWGIDEDQLRAEAVVESWWNQDAHGDQGNGESFGLLQIKSRNYTDPTYPLSSISTAFNVDYVAGTLRYYYDGLATWLNDPCCYDPSGTNESSGTTYYTAGDMWGAMGAWYSGRWHTAVYNDNGDLVNGAEWYIARVKSDLVNRTWTTQAFLDANRGPLVQ